MEALALIEEISEKDGDVFLSTFIFVPRPLRYKPFHARAIGKY
jgi:hypothetical protein